MTANDTPPSGTALSEPDQSGSVGVDVPYTVAAKLARPDKRVIMAIVTGALDTT